MKHFWKKAGRPGFTLIEVLVTVAVIGVLVAVTVPAVTAQIGAADPARILSDLSAITSGIDAFNANMRPTSMPGDVEDLANAVSSTGDLDITGVVYGAASSRWKGPYIEKPITENFNSAAVAAFASGYSSSIQNNFIRCNSKSTIPGCDTASPDYLVVQISPLAAVEFEVLNKAIDASELTGSTTGLSQSTGKLRYLAGSTTAYYFATPLYQ